MFHVGVQNCHAISRFILCKLIHFSVQVLYTALKTFLILGTFNYIRDTREIYPHQAIALLHILGFLSF